MKKIFILLGLFGALCSCDKETWVTEYPYQMTFDGIEPVSEMRFFIGGTELNPDHHTKIIAGFLDRQYSEKTNTGYIPYWSKFVKQDPNWKFSAANQVEDEPIGSGRSKFRGSITNWFATMKAATNSTKRLSKQ